MKLRQGRIGLGFRKQLVGIEEAAQGSDHDPDQPEFKECLDYALRNRI